MDQYSDNLADIQSQQDIKNIECNDLKIQVENLKNNENQISNEIIILTNKIEELTK